MLVPKGRMSLERACYFIIICYYLSKYVERLRFSIPINMFFQFAVSVLLALTHNSNNKTNNNNIYCSTIKSCMAFDLAVRWLIAVLFVLKIKRLKIHIHTSR